MRVYEVCYQLKQVDGWLKVGRFSDRRLAEQTLANLTHKPDFRCGQINSDEQDDDS